MDAIGLKLAELYGDGFLQGWPGRDEAERCFNLVADDFVQFPKSLINVYGASRKAFLWEFSRKLLGKDLPTITQKIGSCVSEGAKNAVDYLSCFEIVRLGQAEDFRPSFAPYYYGTGRVYVGQGRLGNQDGSLGSWMAKAVMAYGTLFADEKGVPEYSGSVASQWGSSKAVLDKWLPIAKAYLIKSAARIRTFDEVVAANTNGYPVTIASNQGFSMLPNDKGFHEGQGEWAHQMCILASDAEYHEPYCGIINSWGSSVHGILKDFHTGENWPAGMLRVREPWISHMLKTGEAYAYSSFQGFPSNDLRKYLRLI